MFEIRIRNNADSLNLQRTSVIRLVTIWFILSSCFLLFIAWFLFGFYSFQPFLAPSFLFGFYSFHWFYLGFILSICFYLLLGYYLGFILSICFLLFIAWFLFGFYYSLSFFGFYCFIFGFYYIIGFLFGFYYSLGFYLVCISYLVSV